MTSGASDWRSCNQQTQTKVNVLNFSRTNPDVSFRLYVWSLQYHKDLEHPALQNQFWSYVYLGTWQDSISARDHLVSCRKRDLNARPNKTSDLQREVQQITWHNHTVWSWNYSHFSSLCRWHSHYEYIVFSFHLDTFHFHWTVSRDFNDVCIVIFVTDLSQSFPTGSKENHLKSQGAYRSLYWISNYYEYEAEFLTTVIFDAFLIYYG